MIFKLLWSLARPMTLAQGSFHLPYPFHLGWLSLTNLMLSPCLSFMHPSLLLGSSLGCQSQGACVTAEVTTALPLAAYRPVRKVCCYLVAVWRCAVSKGENAVDAGKLLSLLLLVLFLPTFPCGQRMPLWAGVSGCVFNSCN